MKAFKYYLMALASAALLNACSDDDPVPGNPVMNFREEPTSALFGDSLSFTINASDQAVPLSTLKAQLYFGEEKVGETVIRTKTSGEDYTGKIYIPYLANIPNGTARLKFILQNIHFTLVEREVELALTRPDFPYLTLVTADKEYRMERVGTYAYSVTDQFAQKVKGYIRAPKMGTNGNEINFGWGSDGITQGTTNSITFSNAQAGEYTIAFNTQTYAASPFITLEVNGQEMDMLDDNNYKADLSLTQGQTVAITGIPGFEEWWIDPDFFEANADGTFKFLPIDGRYRIQVNLEKQYLSVLMLSGADPATLQEDGTGAVWIIGEGIGKPSVQTNQVGWSTEKGLCMAQWTPKKYQITVVAGEQIKTDNINFKFFHQQGWGGEFGSDKLTTESNLVFVGDGINGDNGNLGLLEGVTLEEGIAYRFVVDVTAGNDNAVLTVERVD